MELKHPKFDIPPDCPYENDFIGREEFGENLTKIVSAITSPLTISVNGAWGTGKTVFLKMWEQSLKNDKFSTIYFSAWEDDYCDNAFIALVGQIWDKIKDGTWREMGKTFKEVLIPSIKGVGSHLLNQTGLDAKTLQSHAEKMIEEYATETAGLKDTKKRLKEIAKRCRGETGKPLIIIIDELDRCRPLFAIELLERIKHFFELPGIVFVLGIDREQLGKSICSVYGDIDVDGYLRRFVDLEFFLKTSNSDAFITSTFGKYAIEGNDRWTPGEIEWAAIVSKCFGFSLRETEYLVRTMVVASIIEPELAKRLVLPLLVALKLRDTDFYKKIISEKSNATEIIDRLTEDHNAWELFDLDSETKERMYKPTRAYKLCYELYAISPYEWIREVENSIRDLTANQGQLPEKLFHFVVKAIFLHDHFREQQPQDFFDGSMGHEFKQNLHFAISMKNLSKCIELVEFGDKTEGR